MPGDGKLGRMGRWDLEWVCRARGGRGGELIEGEGSGLGCGQRAPESWPEVDRGEHWNRAGVCWLRGGTARELGEFRVVGALGQAGDVGFGKMMGAQNGVRGHPDAGSVSASQKDEKRVQALDPVTLAPRIRDKKRIVDRKIHAQADPVLESKCEKRL